MDDLLKAQLAKARQHYQGKIDKLIKAIDEAFIWGQVKVFDLEKGDTEWTMKCISEEEWAAIKAEFQEGK